MTAKQLAVKHYEFFFESKNNQLDRAAKLGGEYASKRIEEIKSELEERVLQKNLLIYKVSGIPKRHFKKVEKLHLELLKKIELLEAKLANT